MHPFSAFGLSPGVLSSAPPHAAYPESQRQATPLKNSPAIRMPKSLPLARPLLALALFLCGACSPSKEYVSNRTAGDERPNLVLITVDSLRPDHMSYGGHDRPTSPAIERFAAQGLSFPTAYSQAGWTLPSVSSILSGMYPSEHGATKFGRSIREGVPTLAMFLKDAGYATEAIVAHVALKPKFGLGRGFDAYDDTLLQEGEHHKAITGETLTDRGLAAIDELQQPFFLWLHYFDPHFAYMAHDEWKEFGTENIDRYDSEIAYTDQQIGRFLGGLDARGLDQNSVVVFTADHGEEFGEHKGRWHTSLNEEVARIPLILRAPGLTPAVSPNIAQQVDLLPTLLTLLDIFPPEGLPGRNLLLSTEASDPIFMERARPPHVTQHAMRLGRHKLIFIEPVDQGDEADLINSLPDEIVAGTFLFDVEADPWEQENLFDASNEEHQLLLNLLKQHFAQANQEQGEVEMDADLEEQLRALGYFK